MLGPDILKRCLQRVAFWRRAASSRVLISSALLFSGCVLPTDSVQASVDSATLPALDQPAKVDGKADSKSKRSKRKEANSGATEVQPVVAIRNNALEDVQIGETSNLLRLAFVCRRPCAITQRPDGGYLLEGVDADIRLDLRDRSQHANVLALEAVGDASLIFLDTEEKFVNSTARQCRAVNDPAVCLDFEIEQPLVQPRQQEVEVRNSTPPPKTATPPQTVAAPAVAPPDAPPALADSDAEANPADKDIVAPPLRDSVLNNDKTSPDSVSTGQNDATEPALTVEQPQSSLSSDNKAAARSAPAAPKLAARQPTIRDDASLRDDDLDALSDTNKGERIPVLGALIKSESAIQDLSPKEASVASKIGFSLRAPERLATPKDQEGKARNNAKSKSYKGEIIEAPEAAKVLTTPGRATAPAEVAQKSARFSPPKMTTGSKASDMKGERLAPPVTIKENALKRAKSEESLDQASTAESETNRLAMQYFDAESAHVPKFSGPKLSNIDRQKTERPQGLQKADKTSNTDAVVYQQMNQEPQTANVDFDDLFKNSQEALTNIQKEASAILALDINDEACNSARERLIADAWALDAMVDVGFCKAAEGETNAADADFERLLAYTPDDYRALVGRALIAAVRGESDLAERFFREALNALPPMEESSRIVDAMRRL
ncbi:MAG: hypothetical protein AAF720_10730 [Pseudomonadota bacterium]